LDVEKWEFHSKVKRELAQMHFMQTKWLFWTNFYFMLTSSLLLLFKCSIPHTKLLYAFRSLTVGSLVWGLWVSQ